MASGYPDGASPTVATEMTLDPTMPIQVSIPTTEERSSMGGLKSYTAYMVQVSDFSRVFTIERRFDDFQTLHTDLSTVGLQLPSMPEKKMFASTDAGVVAERRPVFERIIRQCLSSEEALFEPGKKIFEFLDLPMPAVAAVRYLNKDRRLTYVKHCGKLIKPEHEKEHAYRLSHPLLVKANLHMLAAEGLLIRPAGTKEAAAEAEGGGEGGAEVEPPPALEVPASAAKSGVNDTDLETAVIDMVQYSVKHSEDGRKCFVEENGVALMLNLLLRIAQREGAQPLPDQRVRNVLNALIQTEGDKYPEIFATFLAKGGVAILGGFGELCRQHAGFAEFIGKALWLAWEKGTQRAFLGSDSATSSVGEALGLLSALFGGVSKCGQILAGLLLSTLIANGLFAGDRDREAKAAGGLSGLLEELLASSPTSGVPAKAEGENNAAEDVQAFVAGVAKQERSFIRMMACTISPRSDDGSFEHASAPVWSACGFAVWCLAMSKPKPARVAKLRPFLPELAQAGPPSVRWLIGELLLHLNMSAEGGAGAEVTASAESAFHEQGTVETAMAERVSTAQAQLQQSIEQHRGTMRQQRDHVEARKQSLAIGTGGSWSSDLDSSLTNLTAVRNKLASIASSATQRETKSAGSLAAFSKSLEKGPTDSTTAEMERLLSSVLEAERAQQEKRAEFTRHEEALQAQTAFVQQCNEEMAEGEKAVTECRKRISDLEGDVSCRQKDAQQMRTLATSDVASLRPPIEAEITSIEARIGSLREIARKLQAGEPLKEGERPLDEAKAQEMMSSLKQEASDKKNKRLELQAQLARLSGDPAAANDEAARLEREGQELHQRLTQLRSTDLTELERANMGKRDQWQQASSQLQEIRIQRDAADRACKSEQEMLDTRWKNWKPLWSSRLGCWHDRASALGEAQVRSRQLEDALSGTWDAFREEQGARKQVLQAIARAQENLNALAEQMVAVGDLE